MLKENIVVQSNLLIRDGASPLTLHQFKALLCFISEIKMNDTADTVYSFSVRELAEAMDIEQGNALTELKQSLEQLANISWWMVSGTRHSLFRWLNTIDIDNGTVSIKFHERIVPYLFELKKNFTEYRLKYVLPMHSKYGVRLYNLLRSYIMGNKIRTTVNLDIEHVQDVLLYEYKAFSDIEKRVLKPAIADINKYSDIQVSYTKKKRGVKIVSLEFTVIHI